MEERNNLLDKLQQAEGIEDAILKLKEKAMLADRLSEENKKMCQLLQNMKYVIELTETLFRILNYD